MVKILSQSGNSLADIYDVKGSVAGIDQLETRELPIVHEMGATVFSERFSTTIRRTAATGVAQNTDINAVITNLPVMPTRLLSVGVISDDGSRILRLAIMARDPVANLEVPIWVYDAANFLPINLTNAGAVTTFDSLLGNVQATMMPNMVGGSAQQPDMVSQLSLRGTTTGFGAGTVDVTAIFHLGFAFQRGLSSRGVPFPSW